MQYEYNIKKILLDNAVKEREQFLVLPVRKLRDEITEDFQDSDLLVSLSEATRNLR